MKYCSLLFLVFICAPLAQATDYLLFDKGATRTSTIWSSPEPPEAKVLQPGMIAVEFNPKTLEQSNPNDWELQDDGTIKYTGDQ